jgi:hypothetical protein
MKIVEISADPYTDCFSYIKEHNRGTLINTGRNMGVRDKYRKIKEYKKY